MYYKPKYFIIQELVDRKTYEIFGESSLMFFSSEALIMLDNTREFLEVPIIVNNWHIGGSYEFSGFRPRLSTIGGEYSQHRFGHAFDIKPKDLTIAQTCQRIMINKDNEKLKLITTIEDIKHTSTWLHIDCRNILNRIRVVKP